MKSDDGPRNPTGLARLAREPLVQFLAIGLLLFVGYRAYAPGEGPGSAPSGSETSATIRVEREALLAFVQMRTQEPDAAANARAFDALGAEERKIWVDRFVREEALVREAMALGLERDDELIRRRLVQKVEFLTEGLVDASVDVSESALADFMQEHAEDYRIPTLLSFSHVFVSSAGVGGEQARARAGVIAGQLRRARLGPQAALSLGDRFLYNRSYADRTLDEIRSHFGTAFADTLRAQPVDAMRWIGPLESEHGWHVVLLTRRVDSRIPALGEIESLLRIDLRNERRDEATERALREIVGKYPVEIGAGLSLP